MHAPCAGGSPAMSDGLRTERLFWLVLFFSQNTGLRKVVAMPNIVCGIRVFGRPECSIRSARPDHPPEPLRL